MADELTPEMIEAGKRVIMDQPEHFEIDIEEAVTAIYTAMRSSRPNPEGRVMVERAYREGHCDGRYFVTSGRFSTEEIDWQKSEARAALAGVRP